MKKVVPSGTVLFDGSQREELRRQLDSVSNELALLEEKSSLKDRRLTVMGELQKRSERTARVERWLRGTWPHFRMK